MQELGSGHPFSIPNRKGGLPQLANGEIDLYAVLELPPTAPTELLKQRIAELYKLALGNAEHRDIGRRHYFENLLEFLPRCHEILLDAVHRSDYDAYRDATQSQPTLTPFRVRSATEGLSESELPAGNLLDIRTSDAAIELEPPPEVATVLAAAEFVSPFSSLTALAALVAGLIVLVVLRAALRWPLPMAGGAGLAVTAIVITLVSYSKRRKRSDDQSPASPA